MRKPGRRPRPRRRSSRYHRRESFIGTIYRDWAYEDAPAAARSIASAWFSKDREATLTWVASLPEGPARVEALQALKKDADFEVQLGGTVPARLEELLR